MSDGDNKHLLEIINPQTSLNQDFSTSALLAIGVRQLFLEGQRESCLCIVRFIRASLPSTQQIPVASGPFPLLVTIRNIGRHCQVSPLAMAPQMGDWCCKPSVLAKVAQPSLLEISTPPLLKDSAETSTFQIKKCSCAGCIVTSPHSPQNQ